jgi:hypothetical protein
VEHVAVSRTAIEETRLKSLPLRAIAAGEVLLRVESFALTANNVTYAAMGEAMRYWDFFPAGDGEGVVPVWGYACVAESTLPDISTGERVYGYFPMATHLIVQPVGIGRGSFHDGSPHRAHLAAVYNQYRRLPADAGDHDSENIRAVFEPLFLTSFLIERMFARAAWHGATQLIMTSASSKTALALAHVARTNAPEIKRVGLTSTGNVEFVRGTGLYDHVLAYDAVASLAASPSVAVDFAGNGTVLRAVHETLGDQLQYSCLVGLTHWEARGGAGKDMRGPKPILFFAPDHAAATIAELGPSAFASAKDANWSAFMADASALIEIKVAHGLDAGAQAYRALVSGAARADEATIVQIAEGAR